MNKISPYYLFLDDIRSPKNVKSLENQLVDWVVVRSFEQFCNTINQCGVPVFVSYDHDLGSEATKEATKNNFQIFNYDRITEKTGLDCCTFLIEQCRKMERFHPDYNIHSINTIGRRNIDQMIKNYNKMVRDYHKLRDFFFVEDLFKP